jgi:hypothetical protein
VKFFNKIISLSKLFVCALGVFTSCVFSPDDETNFVEINQDVDLPPLYIDLDSNIDTIYVYNPVVFKYKISGYQQNRDYFIQFTVDNSSTQLDAFQGNFTFNPPFQKEGYFIAKLQVFTKSGTGSLADKLDMKRALFERQWVMYVDSKPPEALSVTSIKEERGTLRIEWDPYVRKNYKTYKLFKNRTGFPYGTYTSSKIISDPDSSFYLDTSFVGGEATYWIEVSTYLHSSSGPRHTYNDKAIPKIIRTESITDSTVKVFWTSSKYFSNVSKYSITEVDHNGDRATIKHEVANPFDTVCTIQSFFGASRHLSVRTFSNSSLIENQNIDAVESEKKEFVLGEKIQPYEEIFFSSPKDLYLLTKSDGLVTSILLLVIKTTQFWDHINSHIMFLLFLFHQKKTSS